MMDTNIYYDKVIVFESDARNALKAAAEIDSNTWVHANIHETVVLVTIDTDVHKPQYDRTYKKTVKTVTDILDKYEINYKLKQLRF